MEFKDVFSDLRKKAGFSRNGMAAWACRRSICSAVTAWGESGNAREKPPRQRRFFLSADGKGPGGNLSAEQPFLLLQFLPFYAIITLIR